MISLLPYTIVYPYNPTNTEEKKSGTLRVRGSQIERKYAEISQHGKCWQSKNSTSGAQVTSHPPSAVQAVPSVLALLLMICYTPEYRSSRDCSRPSIPSYHVPSRPKDKGQMVRDLFFYVSVSVSVYLSLIRHGDERMIRRARRPVGGASPDRRERKTLCLDEPS